MLRVSVLGEQAITDSETGAVVTRSPRTLALVAYLAAHAGTPQTRQLIASLFWPDSVDGQALTNLRRELHHARQALSDEPALVVTSKDLCWTDSPSSRVDLRVFDIERGAASAAARSGDDRAVATHAAAALDAYGGEFLPGTYADWILEVRSELTQRCVDLCDLLCDALTRTGAPARAIEVARRRIRLAPLEETGYRNLMRLQAGTGDRAGAASTYHRCASLLERELGISPDPATRALVEQVLETAPGRRAPPRSGHTTVALVGRSREIDLLAAAWQRASSGVPGAVLLHGAAGVGKTRLLTEIARLARADGATVAHSRCFATSGVLALAPVADWLRAPALTAARSTLAAVWRNEIDRLVPPTDTDPAGEDLPERGVGAGFDTWQRHRFFEGLARGLLGVQRPVLLTLDNMQWCNQETLGFLAFCLDTARNAPLMFAVAARDDTSDAGTALAEWSAGLASADLLTEVRVGPLDEPDGAHLAEAICGRALAADERTLLHTVTGGFPLYVVEAMRAAGEPGGAPLSAGSVSSVLHDRVRQSGPAAREVAALAAAVGRDFTLDLLIEASDLDAVTVVRGVDELWRRRIVTEFRDGYDFTHDLLRDTAYTQVGPPQRWLLHRRLAQALEMLHRDDTDPVSAQLAEQYAHGGRPDLAVPYFRRAADIATRRFAYAEAIRLHRRALALVRGRHENSNSAAQELAILEALAAPLNARYGYSSPELQRTLERCIELAATLDRTESAIVGLVGLWATKFVQGDPAGAHRAVTRALTLVEPGTQLCGSAHFAYAGSAVSLGRPAEALDHFALAADLTEDARSWTVGTRPDVHGCAWAAHAHWLLGHTDAARSCCRDAIALARRGDDPFVLTVALGYGAVTRQLCRDLPELLDTVGELRELCDRYAFAYYREWGLILHGWSCDDGAEGVAAMRRGIADLRAAGSFARMPYWLSLLADRLGDRPGDARATLDAATVAARVHADRWWLPEVMRMRAAYDDPPAATARLRAGAALADEHGSAALVDRCERDLARLGVPPPHRSGIGGER